jgi:hypothetical protein
VVAGGDVQEIVESVLPAANVEPEDWIAWEQSLAMLSDADLHRLFTLSQPSTRSPEAGYAP